MKKYLILLLLLPTLSNLTAQLPTDTETIRLHILHKGDFDHKLKTTLNAEQPILLAAWSYTLLETNQTELHLLRKKDEVITLHFEKGKDYFFRISTLDPLAARNRVNIDELSANAFQLELYNNFTLNREPNKARLWVKNDSQ